MSYEELFVQLWEQVKESVEAGNFAKLTMAKKIGKPKLKNIYVRPVYSEGGFTVLLKFSYRSRAQQDTEEELTLDEAFEVVKAHLRNPFFSVLVFSTTKDILFKINKKGIGSITENLPTFQYITEAVRDSERPE